MLIDKDKITRMIPQRAPFVMIDELLEANEEGGFQTTFKIQDNNLFLKEGVVSEGALVENIAQTCAAGFGYLNSQSREGEGEIGFIGAVTKMIVLGSAKQQDQLVTSVHIINTFDRIYLIKGNVDVDGETLLECQMKIVIK